MPTLTPTFDTGGLAQPSAVVMTDPAAAMPPSALEAFLAGSGLNGPFIADLMSAALTHERCGTHLYRSVASRTGNPVLKRRYQEHGEETLRHVEVLEALVAVAGGDPGYVSPMARAVEGMDAKLLESTFMLDGGVDPMLRESVMLDAVLLAETIDHANWELIGQLVPSLPEGEVRDAFQAAVEEVGAQEDEHLGWAKETKAKMVLLQAQSEPMAKAGAKVEELVETVRGWFS
jgi:hypothetical protein